MLSEDEIAHYHQDGLVIPSAYRIPEATMLRIDGLYQQLLANNSGKIKEDAGSPRGYSNRALFLLRGEDSSGRNDFSRGHS